MILVGRIFPAVMYRTLILSPMDQDNFEEGTDNSG